tara:strand:- start:1667 stop:2692 length:1026 start_codon:yes stop_codon:yes gene_type:complete
MLHQAQEIEKETSAPNFWDDSFHAQRQMKLISKLRTRANRWIDIEERIKLSLELLDLAQESQDERMIAEVSSDTPAIFNEAEQLELELVLAGEYDENNAIIAIHAGAGGTESQDWAEMLLRMYTRWADKRGFKANILESSSGEEAGIKSTTLEITGSFCYGYAKAERGVHRLVRLSPFDAAHARHTSFALVEVLPEAEDDLEVEIRADDITVDTFKASGPGGQHVQKSSTAVRITHHKTGIVVSCQNERSQLQNKETALKILRARIMDLELARRSAEKAKLKGEHVAAGWGNQIRSYVLHPYKLVKDHRTGNESTNPEQILSGDLDQFMRAYLLSTVEAAD